MWLLPLLPFIPTDYVESIFLIIQRKIAYTLSNWRILDPLARALIAPWHQVFILLYYYFIFMFLLIPLLTNFDRYLTWRRF